MVEASPATTSIVGSGVRVGKGVLVGGAGVGVDVEVAVGDGVEVQVGVGVAVGVSVGSGVSVGVEVGGMAVGVSVGGAGVRVGVGGWRVGVGVALGVTVAAGWLGSGQSPTASMKIQSLP